jgi:predicted phage tail protein
MMTDPSIAGADAAGYLQTATGAVLLTTPFWADLLYTVNIVAATIASLCGAVVGVTAVWRIVASRRGRS